MALAHEARTIDGLDVYHWRIKRGLTQRKLGELLDIHGNTIAKWERDEQPIAHPRMLALALDALDEHVTQTSPTTH